MFEKTGHHSQIGMYWRHEEFQDIGMERRGRDGKQMVNLRISGEIQIGKYRFKEGALKGKYICAFIL